METATEKDPPGEASVPRTEENETENTPEAEKTAEQKAPDQKEKQQKVTAQKEQPEQEQEPDAPKKSILERFFGGRIEYLPGKTAESCQPSAADSFPAVGTSVPSA